MRAGADAGPGLIWARVLALALASLGPQAVIAQEPQQRLEVPSPILTIDQDQFYAQSDWWARVEAELEAAGQALADENRMLEADLAAEEKDLTGRRAQMTPEAFREAADDFDTRAVDIRAAQEAKSRNLNDIRDRERQAFFQASFPVLGEVLRSRGAVAILDTRAIFLAADAIDVTDEVVARVNEVIGSGPAEPVPSEPQTPPAAETVPEPSPDPNPTPPQTEPSD